MYDNMPEKTQHTYLHNYYNKHTSPTTFHCPSHGVLHAAARARYRALPTLSLCSWTTTRSAPDQREFLGGNVLLICFIFRFMSILQTNANHFLSKYVFHRLEPVWGDIRWLLPPPVVAAGVVVESRWRIMPAATALTTNSGVEEPITVITSIITTTMPPLALSTKKLRGLQRGLNQVMSTSSRITLKRRSTSLVLMVR